MGLFDRFRRAKPASPPAERPSLILALHSLPRFEPATLAEKLAAVEPLRIAPKFSFDFADAKVMHGRAEFDSHGVRLVGFDVPVPPPVMEKTVLCSAWKGEARHALLGHKAHVLLLHEQGGGTPAEQLVALYKLAAVLGGEQLCGVIHESGWTCASAQAVRDFTDAAELKAMRESLPPILFYGVLPFTEGADSWVATKGCHLFGVPDLVIERAGETNTELFGLLHNIFSYMVKGTRIAAGHTMQTAEEQYLKFQQLDPEHRYHDWLKGASETLELKRITKEEINRKA